MRIRPYETEISSDKFEARLTKPIIIDTEEGAEALVDAIEKSMKHEKDMRKTTLNIHEVMTYLKNTPEDTEAVMHIDDKKYDVVYCDGNLICDKYDLFSYTKHENILNALISKNREKTCTLMEQHILAIGKTLRNDKTDVLADFK